MNESFTLQTVSADQSNIIDESRMHLVQKTSLNGSIIEIEKGGSYRRFSQAEPVSAIQ